MASSSKVKLKSKFKHLAFATRVIARAQNLQRSEEETARQEKPTQKQTETSQIQASIHQTGKQAIKLATKNEAKQDQKLESRKKKHGQSGNKAKVEPARKTTSPTQREAYNRWRSKFGSTLPSAPPPPVASRPLWNQPANFTTRQQQAKSVTNSPIDLKGNAMDILKEDQKILLRDVDHFLQNKPDELERLSPRTPVDRDGRRKNSGFSNVSPPRSSCLINEWNKLHSRKLAACFDELGLLSVQGANSVLAACKRFGQNLDKTVTKDAFYRVVHMAFKGGKYARRSAVTQILDDTIESMWNLIDKEKQGRILYHDLHRWINDYLSSLHCKPVRGNKFSKSKFKRVTLPPRKSSVTSPERLGWNPNTKYGQEKGSIDPEVDIVGDRVRLSLAKLKTQENGGFAADSVMMAGSRLTKQNMGYGGSTDSQETDLYEEHEAVFRSRKQKSEELVMKLSQKDENPSPVNRHVVHAHVRNTKWSSNRVSRSTPIEKHMPEQPSFPLVQTPRSKLYYDSKSSILPRSSNGSDSRDGSPVSSNVPSTVTLAEKGSTVGNESSEISRQQEGSHSVVGTGSPGGGLIQTVAPSMEENGESILLGSTCDRLRTIFDLMSKQNPAFKQHMNGHAVHCVKLGAFIDQILADKMATDYMMNTPTKAKIHVDGALRSIMLHELVAQLLNDTKYNRANDQVSWKELIGVFILALKDIQLMKSAQNARTE